MKILSTKLKMKVYLDNAATTKMDEAVLAAMMPLFAEDFGNPSSIHAFGRKTRSAVENARKIDGMRIKLEELKPSLTSRMEKYKKLTTAEKVSQFPVRIREISVSKKQPEIIITKP